MICFVIALQAEASCVIDFFALRRISPETLFPVYRNETMALVISGTGKTAAAAATAYLYSVINKIPDAVWLNVGIAGHAKLDTGNGLIAHKITDTANGKSWYPPLLIDFGVDSANLVSVDIPETVYSENAAYDMEASGFYPIASRASTAEVVHCYKIISDNIHTPIRRMRANDINALIEPHMDSIKSIADRLTALAPVTVEHGLFPLLSKRWHFTTTQLAHLKRLLQRYKALAIGTEDLQNKLSTFRQANDVMNYMKLQLDAAAIRTLNTGAADD